MTTKLLPMLAKKRGRPKIKATVKHVTLFLDGDLLNQFDELCKNNSEKSRTSVFEKMMREYISAGEKISKQDVINTVTKVLTEMLPE
jgi:metal-responsive CopG/Arc/MetJ family transcriptional regulator